MTFKITVLGSAGAIPTINRNPSGMVVVMNNHYFLIDCGEGTQMQLRRYNIKFQRINHIFISHLHGDHFFGLIGLISSMHLNGRTEPLNIYSFPKLQEIIEIQLEASHTHLNYPLIFNPLTWDTKIIYDDEHQYVKTFPLNHSVPAVGFVFTEKPGLKKIKKTFLKKEDVSIDEIKKIKAGADFYGKNGKFYPNTAMTINPPKPRSFAYCCDTKYDESIIEHIKEATLLYHEASFGEEMKDIAEEKLHSTARQAATIALKADVKQLMIGHFSARYKQADDLLLEATAVFPSTIAAEDGLSLSLISNQT